MPDAAFRAYAHVHLADLVDGELEPMLDALQALGFDGVTAEVTSGPFERLRGFPTQPRLLRSDGGFFYPAEAGLYEDTRLKPIAAEWLRQRGNRSYLPALIDATSARGLGLRLRISAFEVGRLAGKYPDAAGKDVFGDVSPMALCPADPDVRALLRATLRELIEGYEPEGVDVVDWRYWSGVLAEHALSAVGEGLLDDLLGICFSESSRQLAQEGGIDVGAAARRVQVEIESILDHPERADGTLEQLVGESEPLGEYLDWQMDVLGEIAQAVVEQYPGQLALPKFVDFPNESSAANLLHMCAADGEHLDELLRSIEEFQAAHDWTELHLQELPLDEPQLLVRLLTALVGADLRQFVIGGVTLLGPRARDVVRQALRFARRSA